MHRKARHETMTQKIKTMLLPLSLLASTAFAQIEAPQVVEPCSGLVRVTAKVSDASKITWHVSAPENLDTLTTGNLLVFAAPPSGRVSIVLAVSKPESGPAIHTATIQVGEIPPPTPQPDLAFQGLVTKVVAQHVPQAYQKYAGNLAKNFEGIAGGNYATVADMRSAVKSRNAQTLMVDQSRVSWELALKLIDRALKDQREQTPAEYVVAFRDIATGLRQSCPSCKEKN